MNVILNVEAHNDDARRVVKLNNKRSNLAHSGSIYDTGTPIEESQTGNTLSVYSNAMEQFDKLLLCLGFSHSGWINLDMAQSRKAHLDVTYACLLTYIQREF